VILSVLSSATWLGKAIQILGMLSRALTSAIVMQAAAGADSVGAALNVITLSDSDDEEQCEQPAVAQASLNCIYCRAVSLERLSRLRNMPFV